MIKTTILMSIYVYIQVATSPMRPICMYVGILSGGNSLYKRPSMKLIGQKILNEKRDIHFPISTPKMNYTDYYNLKG